MRTYGRYTDELGNKTWVVIETDANGYNDQVYLTTLAQCLKLNLGESPFFANYGIPQQQTIMTQVFPNFYVMQTQGQFINYFAALRIIAVPGPAPVYTIKATTHSGASIMENVLAEYPS